MPQNVLVKLKFRVYSIPEKSDKSIADITSQNDYEYHLFF